jgi:hypothetical protein
LANPEHRGRLLDRVFQSIADLRAVEALLDAGTDGRTSGTTEDFT